MFVMEEKDLYLHLPPSKHRINCDATVGEKKTLHNCGGRECR